MLPKRHLTLSFFASIPGGDHLTAQSYAQTVIGAYNSAGGIGNKFGGGSGDDVISGGYGNYIDGAVSVSTIGGGDSLTANSFAQTVMGYNNIVSPTPAFTQGTSHFYATGGPQDEPLVIVGNGNNGNNPSNAIEVSYDGHITVFDQNKNTHVGSAAPVRTPIFGATYNDNTIVAWGDISPVGFPAQPTVNSDFGVQSVLETFPGVYLVKLWTNLPDGGGTKNLTFGSVTVTVNDDTPSSDSVGVCGYATASHFTTVGLNTLFTVRTYTGSLSSSDCHPRELPFFFKVTGR